MHGEIGLPGPSIEFIEGRNTWLFTARQKWKRLRLEHPLAYATGQIAHAARQSSAVVSASCIATSRRGTSCLTWQAIRR